MVLAAHLLKATHIYPPLLFTVINSNCISKSDLEMTVYVHKFSLPLTHINTQHS